MVVERADSISESPHSSHHADPGRRSTRSVSQGGIDANT
jgi:hypothetical protein